MPAPVFTRSGVSVATMKAGYRLPTFFPFPRENPHTRARAPSTAEYRLAFASASPEAGMPPATPAKAIATHEQTVVPERSPFDAWIEGDQHATGFQPGSVLPLAGAN
jgi:cytochrome c peroxidase